LGKYALGKLGAPNTSDIKVFISSLKSKCDECGEDLGTSAWITLKEDKGALCLSCGDLDHLMFLLSGDACLSRRAKKHSMLSAIVLKWSKSRKRYERQGLLVTEEGLRQAEETCLADADARERRRLRQQEQAAEHDQEYVRRFAAEVAHQFPRCPRLRAAKIAEHACLKYSGRVGRSAKAKALDSEAIRLAVSAHVRHTETQYDELLSRGDDRHEARLLVQDRVNDILARWSRSAKPQAANRPTPRE
jgi:hypothetical protein